MPGPVNPDQIHQIDRFPVVRFIASGGQAWVFEVEDPQKYNDRYALKLLKPDAAAGTDLVRFEDETRFQMTIKHPNLLRVYERGQDETTGCLFYVMDLMTLGTLGEVRIADPEATITSSALVADVAQICKYVSGCLSGLAHIHDQSLIHRDIKPQNIFIDQGEIAKLGDLGIAKRRGEAGVTERGYAPGTVLYMSPEQMTGDELGPESDIFAMGLVLYRVLTGRTIYEEIKELDSTNGNAVIRHLWELQRSGDDFIYEFPPRVPEPVREVVRKACAIRIEDRFRDADEMRVALERAVLRIEAATTGIHAIPAGGMSGITKLALAAVLLAAVGVGGWFGWNAYQQGQVMGEIRQHLRRVTEVGLQVDELTQVAQAGGAAPGLADDARALKSDGDAALEDAKRFIEAGSPRFALLELEEAEKVYATACGQIAKGHLQPATDSATGAAVAAIGTVHPSAQEYQAERWKELQSWKERLAAPIQASDCEGAKQLIARGEDAGRAKAAAGAIEVAMRDQLPKIAETEIAGAGKAGDAARAVAASFAPYKSALSRGDKSLSKARKQLEGARGSGQPEQFEASMASSTEAKAAYQAALDASDAFEKRAKVQRLVADARKVGVSVGLNRARLEGADAAFGKQSWAEAGDGYAGVAQDIGAMLGDSEPARTALADARSARDAAIRSGVSGGDLQEADELLQSGIGRIQPGKFGEAESTLGRAKQFYEAKQREHTAGMAESEQERASARTAIAQAASAREQAKAVRGSGPIYVAALEQGEDALKRARTLSRDRRYAGVPALAGEASDAFNDAASIAPAERAKQAAEKKAAEATKAGLGETLWGVDANVASQAYAARDWDTSAREYERLDGRIGELLARSKPAVAAAEKAAKKRKPVPNGHDALLDGDPERDLGVDALRRGDFAAATDHFDAATQQYARFVANRRPTLKLSPGGKSRTIRIGERVNFKASVSDPDGDAVEVRFDLDGRTATTGKSFSFKPVKPGTYVIQAVATDGRAKATKRQTVVVMSKAQAVATPKPAPAPPKPVASQGGGVKSAVAKFLEDYRKAFERKDMSALRTMRVMDDDEVGDIENVFWDCGDLKVDLNYDKGRIQVNGKKAQVEFTQTHRGCMLTEGSKSTFAASLWQRGGGDWKMRLSPAQ